MKERKKQGNKEGERQKEGNNESNTEARQKQDRNTVKVELRNQRKKKNIEGRKKVDKVKDRGTKRGNSVHQQLSSLLLPIFTLLKKIVFSYVKKLLKN